MMTCEQVSRWHAAAAEQFGDPSVPVAQLFAMWRQNLRAIDDHWISVGMVEGAIALVLAPQFPPLPLEIQLGEARINAAGELEAFGAERLTTGVWVLSPSLNVEGLIHGFLVLYDVPDPAPWERRIVLLT